MNLKKLSNSKADVRDCLFSHRMAVGAKGAFALPVYADSQWSSRSSYHLRTIPFNVSTASITIPDIRHLPNTHRRRDVGIHSKVSVLCYFRHRLRLALELLLYRRTCIATPGRHP